MDVVGLGGQEPRVQVQARARSLDRGRSRRCSRSVWRRRRARSRRLRGPRTPQPRRAACRRRAPDMRGRRRGRRVASDRRRARRACFRGLRCRSGASSSNTPRKVPPRSKQSTNTGVSFSAASSLQPGTSKYLGVRTSRPLAQLVDVGMDFGAIDGPDELDLVARQPAHAPSRSLDGRPNVSIADALVTSVDSPGHSPFLAAVRLAIES